MSTTIGGHTLTRAERRTLDEVLDYMRKNSGDTGISPTTSPLGDGREVSVYEVFGERNNQDNAQRRTVTRLHEEGILRACELDLDRGMLRWKPL